MSPMVGRLPQAAGMSAFEDLTAVPSCDVVIVLVATGAQLLDAVKVGSTDRDA